MRRQTAYRVIRIPDTRAAAAEARGSARLLGPASTCTLTMPFIASGYTPHSCLVDIYALPCNYAPAKLCFSRASLLVGFVEI